MKKKSPRGIPDFASKRPGSKPTPVVDALKPVHGAPVPPPAPRVKPQATSRKSGQRGT